MYLSFKESNFVEKMMPSSFIRTWSDKTAPYVEGKSGYEVWNLFVRMQKQSLE